MDVYKEVLTDERMYQKYEELIASLQQLVEPIWEVLSINGVNRTYANEMCIIDFINDLVLQFSYETHWQLIQVDKIGDPYAPVCDDFIL
jgi:hypothetical protein